MTTRRLTLLKQKHHTLRQRRTRSAMHGTAVHPRLCVFRSLKYIEAQLINDDTGKTLCAASDRKHTDKKTKTQRAVWVGEELGKLALAKGITTAVFDRGAYRYHGRVKALADAVRAGGIKF
ncbi:50S ribosomal protein L18 [Candidatus Uhrbacteria bacterium]|nr:50S ribosomal protein L18 [Candidatus Uhrbacteria bacterium]